MGAWGTGIFENDDALDWIDELVDSNGFITETLNKVISGEEQYLEAPECNEALAAAGVIAYLKNPLQIDVPEEIKQWISGQKLKDLEYLSTTAKKVIMRIKTNSELKDLWEDSEDVQEWYASLEKLFDLLQ